MDLPPPPPPPAADEDLLPPPPPAADEDLLLPPPPQSEDDIPAPRASLIPGPPPRASLIPGPPPRASLIPGPPPRASLIPGPPPPIPVEADQPPEHKASMIPPPSALIDIPEDREDLETADQVGKLALTDTAPVDVVVVPKGSVKKLSLLFNGGGANNRKPTAPLIDMSQQTRSAAARMRTESTMPGSQDNGDLSRAAAASVNSAKSILPVKQETATVSSTNAMHIKATYHEISITHNAPQANTLMVQRDLVTGLGRVQIAQDTLLVKQVNGTPVHDSEACKRELESLASGQATLEASRLDMHVLCPKCNTDFDLKAQRVFDTMNARCPACRQVLIVDTKRQ